MDKGKVQAITKWP